jgi:hypothetical protein
MYRKNFGFISANFLSHFTKAGSFNILTLVNAALRHLPSFRTVINPLAAKNMAFLID